MALPLTIAIGATGGWLMFQAGSDRQSTGRLSMLLLLAPIAFSWDSRASSPVFSVQTAVEVAAPPEVVWKHVITFPDLESPREWLFRSGLAYPIRARIEGTGPRAVRYCEFSTGAFVEPVEVWNEARLLQFAVTQNPAPMRELSLYGQITPKHLRGYLVAKQGQFRLTRLANQHTLLEGTTWYQHGLRPVGYWRFWSDAILHRIHLRVLQHIQRLSEKDAW